MPTMNFTDMDAPKAEGIRYMVAVGRRQPMHLGHLRSIEHIMQHGYTPIMVIGSTNTAEKTDGSPDPLFEPLSNPLTFDDQAAQIKQALKGKVEGKDYYLVAMPDLGNTELWNQTLIDKLKGQIPIDGKYPNLLTQSAFHFIGKAEDKRPRRLISADGKHKEVLAYFWEETFERLGLPVFHDTPHDEVPLGFSATQLRALDLNHLTTEERAMFAAPDFIIMRANAARADNPEVSALKDIPVTTFDLTLERLANEKHISTSDILAAATAISGTITLDSLKEAARSLNGSMRSSVHPSEVGDGKSPDSMISNAMFDRRGVAYAPFRQ